MRKIGFFNIGKLGLVKSAGTGKTDINKVIEKWIPKHMVFWYDMSKPVDTYIPGVTYANQFVNDGGKVRYDTTINKCTITHTPTSENKYFWLVKCNPSSTIDSYRIRVIGLPKGFIIQSGFYSNKITSDGEYDIASFTNTAPTTRYPGFYLAGDNISDVDCNIVVEEIPTRQSVPTNEILKANPYLQDFSGNNRPLKLNNFLFAAMSGVGGYETNFSDNSIWISSPQHGNIINNHTYNPMLKGSSSGLYTATGSVKVKFKATVTGMKSGYRLEFGSGDVAPSDKSIYEDGEYEFGSGDVAVPYGFKLYADDYSNPNTDVIIELKEVYPNALVTDGVDDYGVVENFKSLQNYMMFFQCAIIRPNTSKGMFSTTSIESGNQGWMLLQGQSANSVRFGNNAYTNFEFTPSVEDKISYVLSANNELMTCYVGEEKATLAGTYRQTGANMSLFLSDMNSKARFGSMAFYKSILFDSVPTKQNDGFTEQDLIDYYIPKAIVTITVVDVSSSPIQDAVVTVGGIQYKTLSDGTVKVRGMANSTMSLSVKKDGYMPFSDNSWKFADSRITLEVLRNTVITENGYSILLENNGLILTE